MKQTLAVLCAIGICFGLLLQPLAAQTQGVLGVPPKGQPSNKPQANPAPPTAAPRTPVQRVAPSAKPVKPTPVVRPAKNAHAVKPKIPVKPVAAAAVAGVAGVAAATVAVPQAKPVPAPVVAKPELVRPDPTKGSVTGAPLPRWAAFRSDEVNLRAGPGTRYPIEWLYHRRNLPVEILREFEVWRLIEDQDGQKGWVHQATLTNRRGFVVKAGDQTVRKSASEDASPVAILKLGVVGRIRACDAKAAWCDVEAGGYRGWIKRDTIWGLFPNEAVN